MRNNVRRRRNSSPEMGEQPLRHAFRGTTILVTAVLLASCDPQAPNTSSNADSAAVQSATGGAKQHPADQTVHIVIKPQFDEADSFSEGLAAVRVGAKFGYIDKQGTIVIKR